MCLKPRWLLKNQTQNVKNVSFAKNELKLVLRFKLIVSNFFDWLNRRTTILFARWLQYLSDRTLLPIFCRMNAWICYAYLLLALKYFQSNRLNCYTNFCKKALVCLASSLKHCLTLPVWLLTIKSFEFKMVQFAYLLLIIHFSSDWCCIVQTEESKCVQWIRISLRFFFLFFFLKKSIFIHLNA